MADYIKNGFKCEVCERLFSRKCHLMRHLAKHNQNGDFSCDECGKQVSSLQSLKTHKLTHVGYKPFVCGICQKTFSQKINLTYHMRTHSGDKPFICHVCNKGFAQKANLENHIRIHTGERPFSCYECGMAFTQIGNLTKHMTLHGLEGYSYKTSKRKQVSQKKKRPRESEWITKLDMKSDDKGAERSAANYVPGGKSVLQNDKRKKCAIRKSGSKTNNHTVIDTAGPVPTQETKIGTSIKGSNMENLQTEKPCISFPGEFFSHDSSCGDEKQIDASREREDCLSANKGNEDFSLEECGKQSSTLQSLKMHKSTHVENKPYVCDICQKGFSHKSYLPIHMYIHTGEKPYVCSFCNKRFAQKTSLKNHKRLHTGERPYSCNECKMTFTQLGGLNYHRSRYENGGCSKYVSKTRKPKKQQSTKIQMDDCSLKVDNRKGKKNCAIDSRSESELVPQTGEIKESSVKKCAIEASDLNVPEMQNPLLPAEKIDAPFTEIQMENDNFYSIKNIEKDVPLKEQDTEVLIDKEESSLCSSVSSSSDNENFVEIEYSHLKEECIYDEQYICDEKVEEQLDPEEIEFEAINDQIKIENPEADVDAEIDSLLEDSDPDDESHGGFNNIVEPGVDKSTEVLPDQIEGISEVGNPAKSDEEEVSCSQEDGSQESSSSQSESSSQCESKEDLISEFESITNKIIRKRKCKVCSTRDCSSCHAYFLKNFRKVRDFSEGLSKHYRLKEEDIFDIFRAKLSNATKLPSNFFKF